MNISDKPGRSAAGSSRGRGPRDGALDSLVRAESLIQLALLLPAATLIGWGIGVGLDHWLNQHWISIAGLLLGAAAGFVQIFRVVFALNKD